ncbi:hypothetical protein [Thermoleptolyngbya sp. C42_A2020_037]|uniref:DUF6962 family protein n=1 Tax=Thermoleptolyngbya sp. C42_A2020_037 TaxID=2747799 RepID=UPI0019EE94B1|nr:hypothetical protein [Thermoleptolyngbya sp. C42_A2020_037]MBF2083704.1 hypothetical protein [Thermoleptolyngbya sp. C42_A2020_037]
MPWPAQPAEPTARSPHAMTLSEPITTLTDYAIALECLIFAVCLLKQAEPPKPTKGWILAFGSTALAAALGGTLHGWSAALSPGWALGLWRAMLLALGVASYGLVAGASAGWVSGGKLVWVQRLALGKLAVYGLWAWQAESFWGAIADYLLSMLVVVGLVGSGVVFAVPAQRVTAGWLVGGVGLSFAAAGVQVVQLALRPWLMPNDLYHLVQMVALYAFFHAAR